MATGDSGCEAYTAIAWGVGLSHERSYIAGAEGFHSPEGNMCGTARRGADALPGSKATSRAKGSHRNLGGLGSDRRSRVVAEDDGPHREGEEPKPTMYGQVKSDLAHSSGEAGEQSGATCCGAIVTGQAAAESVERRAETKGNAHRHSTHRTQSGVGAQAFECMRQYCAVRPRWEPYAGKPHVRFCAGVASNVRPYRDNAARSSH